MDYTNCAYNEAVDRLKKMLSDTPVTNLSPGNKSSTISVYCNQTKGHSKDYLLADHYPMDSYSVSWR